MPWACWALTRFIALAELNGNRIWHLIASSILAFRLLKNSWLFFFRDGGTTSMIKTRPRGPRSKLSPLYYLIKIEVIYPIKRAKIKLNSEIYLPMNVKAIPFLFWKKRLLLKNLIQHTNMCIVRVESHFKWINVFDNE